MFLKKCFILSRTWAWIEQTLLKNKWKWLRCRPFSIIDNSTLVRSNVLVQFQHVFWQKMNNLINPTSVRLFARRISSVGRASDTLLKGCVFGSRPGQSVVSLSKTLYWRCSSRLSWEWVPATAGKLTCDRLASCPGGVPSLSSAHATETGIASGLMSLKAPEGFSFYLVYINTTQQFDFTSQSMSSNNNCH